MPLILILSITCFSGAVSIRLLDPIIPDIATTYGVLPSTAALLASAFTFPYALSQPVLGPMGDAYGKARVIKIGLAVLAVALLVSALAPTVEIMFASRIVAGMAGGAVIPVALAMIGDRVPFEERQLALSQLLSAMLAAQFVSLIGTGLIAGLFGWRYALYLAAGLTVVSLVAAIFALKPRQVARHDFNVEGLRESYADVFSNPKAWICYLAVFGEGVLIFGLIPYIAIMMQARGAGGVTEAGIAIAGMGVGGIIMTFAIKFLLRVFGGMHLLIQVGGVVAAVGFIGVAVAGSWWFEGLAFVLIGFGFYAVHSSLQTQATELAPDHRGAAVALHAFFFFLGHAAGPPLYAGMFALLGAPVTILAVAAATLGACLILGPALRRRDARAAPAA
ncbi:MAG: MFS transporter [Pseudomonadota bacterium]